MKFYSLGLVLVLHASLLNAQKIDKEIKITLPQKIDNKSYVSTDYNTQKQAYEMLFAEVKSQNQVELSKYFINNDFELISHIDTLKTIDLQKEDKSITSYRLSIGKEDCLMYETISVDFKGYEIEKGKYKNEGVSVVSDTLIADDKGLFYFPHKIHYHDNYFYVWSNKGVDSKQKDDKVWYISKFDTLGNLQVEKEFKLESKHALVYSALHVNKEAKGIVCICAPAKDKENPENPLTYKLINIDLELNNEVFKPFVSKANGWKIETTHFDGKSIYLFGNAEKNDKKYFDELKVDENSAQVQLMKISGSDIDFISFLGEDEIAGTFKFGNYMHISKEGYAFISGQEDEKNYKIYIFDDKGQFVKGLESYMQGSDNNENPNFISFESEKYLYWCKMESRRMNFFPCYVKIKKGDYYVNRTVCVNPESVELESDLKAFLDEGVNTGAKVNYIKTKLDSELGLVFFDKDKKSIKIVKLLFGEPIDIVAAPSVVNDYTLCSKVASYGQYISIESNRQVFSW
ncbi:hypothetical protein OAO55_02220 [Bacteroidales bacterium]|nr:hypothetical protein [Bacteroidales bacterium]